MDVGNVARQYWAIAVLPDWKREAKNFEEPNRVSRSRPAQTAYNPITCGGRVSFLLIYFADRYRELGRSEKKIAHAAAELARWSVIIGRRVLNISEPSRGKNQGDGSEQQLLFHKPLPHVNNLFVPKATIFLQDRHRLCGWAKSDFWIFYFSLSTFSFVQRFP